MSTSRLGDPVVSDDLNLTIVKPCGLRPFGTLLRAEVPEAEAIAFNQPLEEDDDEEDDLLGAFFAFGLLPD